MSPPRSPRAAAILDAATRVFARRSFAATSMRQVAAEAGVSLGAIYHHFEGKESLLHAITADLFRRVTDGLDGRLAAGGTAGDQLTAAIENHVAFFAAHLDGMRVLAHELDTLSGAAGRELAALRRAYAARVRGVLARLRPDLGAADLRLAAACLFGMLNWTHRWIRALPPGTDVAAVGRRMARLYLDGLSGLRLEAVADGDRPGAVPGSHLTTPAAAPAFRTPPAPR